MKAVLPLPSFEPSQALPEHFLTVKLNSKLLEGTIVRLPAGVFSSLEAALSDPRTTITHNGNRISPFEMKILNGRTRWIGD